MNEADQCPLVEPPLLDGRAYWGRRSRSDMSWVRFRARVVDVTGACPTTLCLLPDENSVSPVYFVEIRGPIPEGTEATYGC